MRCEQEMCENWAGDGGCPCDVLQIEPEDRPVVRENDPTVGPAGAPPWFENMIGDH